MCTVCLTASHNLVVIKIVDDEQWCGQVDSPDSALVPILHRFKNIVSIFTVSAA